MIGSDGDGGVSACRDEHGGLQAEEKQQISPTSKIKGLSSRLLMVL